MQGCKEAGIPVFGTLWDFVSSILLALAPSDRELTTCEVSVLYARLLCPQFSPFCKFSHALDEYVKLVTP
jgi:hypothetical protein